MSLGRRAYDLLRGYVNRELDRIEGIDRLRAESELADSLDKTGPASEPAIPRSHPDAPEPKPVDPRAQARKILGVEENDDFSTIRKAFEKLNRRSDPANFDEGSPEREGAEQIRQRVNWAYRILTESMDSREKRFRSLEIE